MNVSLRNIDMCPDCGRLVEIGKDCPRCNRVSVKDLEKRISELESEFEQWKNGKGCHRDSIIRYTIERMKEEK